MTIDTKCDATANLVVLDAVPEGCAPHKRHPWLWGAGYHTKHRDMPVTYLASEHDTQEQATRAATAPNLWRRQRDPEREWFLVAPSEPMPVYRSIEAVIESAPLKAVQLYEFECPICGYTIQDASDYSSVDFDQAHELYTEHLRDRHRLPSEDDLAACKHCGDEFNCADGAPCRESSEGCESSDA